MNNQEIEQAIQDKGLTFGLAIEALKAGKKVARAGWNGKGMWLILVPGQPAVNFTKGSPYMKAGLTYGEILSHIDMYTVNAQGRRAMLPGWVASQTDMLAEDWAVVECDTALVPHQQRVVADEEERGRLICQEEVMKQYSEILGERIAEFKNTD